jgi:putative toxin-antitoxin system antitoxin component (TIGR02293 family)
MASLAVLLDRLYETEVIDTTDVARVSGTHVRSVNRWHASRGEPRRESEERILELKAVVDLTRRVMSDHAARLWLRAPNPDLGYEKPLDLVGTGHYQRVVNLLLALAEGVTA